MRRTIFLAIIAALLFAPVAHAAADPVEITRDCADDDVLQGDYSLSELRDARNNLPTDIDEYSACRDVLSRAIAEASGSSTGGGWEQDGGGSTAGGGGSDPSAGTEDGGTTSPESSPTPAPHSLEEDKKLLAVAAQRGGEPMVVDGRPVSPGATRLAAQVGRNGIPATTVVVLALFVVALLTVLALPLLRRRRGVDRPQQ